MSVTLDGVMQAPGRADEDSRGGFTRGGWALPYFDDVMGKAMSDGFPRAGGLLFGRRTYEDFYKVWPNRTDGNPFTAVLDNSQKYVASTTLQEPLPWQNSTLLKDQTDQFVLYTRRLLSFQGRAADELAVGRFPGDAPCHVRGQR